MRRVAVVVIAGLLSLGSVEPGIAGPFGLSMGMKPSEVGGKLEKNGGPGVYQTTEVPKPHHTFIVYTLLFGPTTGLCKFSAISDSVETNVYGNQLKSNFDGLEKRLKTLYGKNKRNDLLAPGSIWNEPKDFMVGLLKQDRMLASFWEAKEGSTLKDNLRGIMLQASADSQERGLITVIYEFQNAEECQKELNAAEDDAL